VICIPYAWMNEAVEPITFESRDWIGSIASGYEWYYADYMLLLTLGGIPWQVNGALTVKNSLNVLGFLS
jgi:high affinity choline transporter 7